MNLIKACRQIMIDDLFYGLFLLNIDKSYSKKIPTLAVTINGINTCLLVNEEFWNELREEEQVAVLKHEVLHLCFKHLQLSVKFMNKKLYNIACDLEVNQYIKDLPGGSLTLDLFADLKLEQFAGSKYYYDRLKQKCEDKDFKDLINNLSKGLEESEESSDSTCGSHSFWDKYEELSDAEKTLVNNQIEHNIKTSAENTTKARGSIPGEMSSIIDELFKIEPEVFNWKAYFRRVLGNSGITFTKKSKRKESKRFPGAAGIKVRRKHKILVGIDTSGSVSNSELLEFFSEIHHIYKAGVAITIVECDVRITDIYEYKGTFKGSVSGRGGTDFDPVIDYYNKHIDYTTCIYFTDGECPASHLKPHGNMIWIISSRGNPYDKFPGQVIKIPKQ